MVEGVLTGDITSHTHSYLPLSGGTIKGNVYISGNDVTNVPFNILTPSAGNTGYIRFGAGMSSSTELGHIGFSAKGVPAMNYQGVVNTLLHSGNYNSYAPTLTGTGASGTWGIDISGNASSATKLQTPRTIWGQSFDGTGNVAARLGVGLMSSWGIYYGLSILPAGNPYWGVRTFLTYDEGSTMGAYEIAARNSYGLTISRGGGGANDFGNIPTNLNYTSLVEIRPNGNVLIGTTTDNGYKLQVGGSERVYGDLIVDGEVSALVA